MRNTFLDTQGDMQWLRDVHLPGLDVKFKSACLYGNEDSPERIEAYERREPLTSDTPAIFVRDEDGTYRLLK